MADHVLDELALMREAARRAGVPEHMLPLETPAESRSKKAVREPWETKTTSAVRHVLSVLAHEGILTPERRSEAPQFSTPTVAVDYAARLLVECRVDNVAPFDADYFASIGGVLVVRAVGYGHLVAWIPADELPAFASREDVQRIRHIDPPYTDAGSITTQGDGIHRRTMLVSPSTLTAPVSSWGSSRWVENLAEAQASNDLPDDAPTSPGIEVPPGCTGSDDEGTAMLEIVHDLAPGRISLSAPDFPGPPA